MKYEVGKMYRVDTKVNKGRYKVTKITKPRKYTGTVFVYFNDLDGTIGGSDSFMLHSDFDLASQEII